MKTLTALFFAATILVSFNANADAVHGDPGIGDIFPMADVSLQANNIKIVADTGETVWSVTYEEYINPADFNMTSQQTIAGLIQEMEDNPPAAGGKRSASVFAWDETADEFQLQ